MNSKKLLVVGLTVVCVASLTVNVYLHMQNKTLTSQLAEQSTKAVTLSAQVEDGNTQISSLQAQIDDLQALLDSMVVETLARPQTAETEQSTQGAANSAANNTDYGQQQASKPQQPSSKPSTPPASSKPETPTPPASSPQAPSKPSTPTKPTTPSKPPSQQDVDDYLNGLGIGNTNPGGASNPSGSTGGGGSGYVDPEELGDVSGALGDKGYSTDDFNWD